MRRGGSCPPQWTSSQAPRPSAAGSDSNGSSPQPDSDEEMINAPSQQTPAQRPNLPVMGTFHPINRPRSRVQVPNASMTGVAGGPANIAPTAAAAPTAQTRESTPLAGSHRDAEVRRRTTPQPGQRSGDPLSPDAASTDIAERGGEIDDDLEHEGHGEDELEVLTDEESDAIDPYESDAPEAHSRWQIVTYGNAKCDNCGEYKQPNVRMVRCKGTCAFQICERCEAENGGRQHNTSQLYRWIKPNPRRQAGGSHENVPGASTSMGQRAASGNRNVAGDNNAAAHSHPTRSTPRQPWQSPSAQSDLQQMEFGIPIVYTQAHIRAMNDQLARQSPMASSSSVNAPVVGREATNVQNQASVAQNAQGSTQARFHPYQPAYLITRPLAQGMRGALGTSQPPGPVRRQGEPRRGRGQLFPRDALPENGGVGNTATAQPNMASHEQTALHALVRGAMRRFGNQPNSTPNAAPPAILPTASSSPGAVTQNDMARVKYTLPGGSSQIANAQRVSSQDTGSRDATGQTVTRSGAIPQSISSQTATPSSSNAVPQSRENRGIAASGNSVPRTSTSQNVLRQEDPGYVADTSSYMQTGSAQGVSSARTRMSGRQNPSRSVSPEGHGPAVRPSSVASVESDDSEEHPLMSEYQQRQQRGRQPQNMHAERAAELGLNLQNSQERAWWYLVLAANEEYDRLHPEERRQETTARDTENNRPGQVNTSQSARTEPNSTASRPNSPSSGHPNASG